MPVLVRHLEQRLDEQPSSVVDPDVDAAEAFDGCVRQPLDVLGPPGVADEHERVATGLVHRLLGRRSLVERHAGDIGAGTREGGRDRLADAARGAGDDGAPARQGERRGRGHGDVG